MEGVPHPARLSGTQTLGSVPEGKNCGKKKVRTCHRQPVQLEGAEPGSKRGKGGVHLPWPRRCVQEFPSGRKPCTARFCSQQHFCKGGARPSSATAGKGQSDAPSREFLIFLTGRGKYRHSRELKKKHVWFKTVESNKSSSKVGERRSTK